MIAQWMVLLLLPFSAFTAPTGNTGTQFNSGIRYLKGTNGYGYVADDHYKIEMRNVDGSVEGVYGYRMPDGNTHTTTYVSDKNGYRLQENDVLQRFRSQGGILQRFYPGSADKRQRYKAVVPVQTAPQYHTETRSSPGESVNLGYEVVPAPVGADAALGTYSVPVGDEIPETYGVPVQVDEVPEVYGVPVQVDEVPEVYGVPVKRNDDPYYLEDIFFGPHNQQSVPTIGQAVPGTPLASVVETDKVRQGAPQGVTGSGVVSVPEIDEPQPVPDPPTGVQEKKKGKLEKKADHAVALPDAKAIAPGAGVAQSRIQGTAIAEKEAYASPVASSYTGKKGMSLSAPSGVAIVGPGGIAIADTFSLGYASMIPEKIKKLREKTEKTRKQMKTDPKPQPLYYRDFIGRKERFGKR